MRAGVSLGVALLLAVAGVAAGSTRAVRQHPTAAERVRARLHAPLTSERLSLVAEPAAGDGPFVSLIGHARRSVDLVIYELHDAAVEGALVSDARRGVRVRVLLDAGYEGVPDSADAAAFAYLRARGIAVRYSSRAFTLTHEKAIVVDGAEAAVMTLNLAGAYGSTRDFAVLDSQAADVRAIDAVFTADFARRPISPSSGTGDLVWSPGAARPVLALIASARHSIVLENEEMAYAPAVTALCDAARRGVAVTVVMTYAREWIAPFDRLTGCGVRVRAYFGQRYYIHAKAIDVDSRRALIGSQNLSATSLDDNRELGVVVTATSLVRALGTDLASDAAGGRAWRMGR